MINRDLWHKLKKFVAENVYFRYILIQKQLQIIFVKIVKFMTSKIILLVLVGLACALSSGIDVLSLQSQYVPIPKRYPGLLIGQANAPITIELVYDPTCDGSADFDQQIQQFISGLDQDTLSKLSFKYAINVLPYHISSFKLAIAVKYVSIKQGDQQALRVLRYFLQNIPSWDEQSIKKITINEHLNNIANKVSSLTGLNRDDIRKEITHFSSTDGLTRQWAKYVMGSLRIPGTPQMLVNGVRVDGGVNMNAADLTKFIKSLL